MLLTFAVDLFADINQLGLSSNIGETEFGFDNQAQVVAIGNETFFVAEDGSRGSELWKTNGTAGGTVLVQDILPGAEGSSPDGLTDVGGMLYFTALDEFGETDLWKSDGTEVGTEIVFDADAAGVYGLASLTESNDRLFFTAYEISGDDLLAPELWVSDGTSAGTVQVIELNENALDSEGPRYLIDVDDVLYFTSDDDGATDPNRELWKSDGTAGGTVKVSEVDGDPLIGSYPRYLTNVDGTLFFAAYGAAGDEELFRVNNTADGTLLVADLNPTGDSSPRELTTMGTEVFFSATDGTTGRQLYKADASGVTLVADTTNGLGNSSPIDLEVVGTELFFSANGSVPGATEGTFESAGRELHKTDGTAGNFTLVADIVPIGSSNPSQLTEVDGRLFFAADDVTGDGLELWAHDPVADTTTLMVDSYTGDQLSGAPNDGAPQLFGALGTQLLFTTTDDNLDRELWTSDGTSAGTALVMNINPATEDANVTDLISIGDDIFFVANDGINGEAIWRADTLTGEAELFEDITNSSTDEISKLTSFGLQNDRIVFYNNTFGSAGGVFVTDGQNPPALIADFRPVELDNEGTMFVATDDQIYFVAPFNGVNKLFSSNGSTTAAVIESGAGEPDYSNPSNLTGFTISGTTDLYFSADGDGIGNELFVTSFEPPTSPGSGGIVVQQLGGGGQAPGAASSFPQELTVSGSALFFTADPGDGRELFRRTSNAVQLVEDLRASGGSDPRNLTDVNGVLYFSANNGSDGFEPYRSQGVAFNTFQIADINPGSASSHPDEFISAIGGQVFFAADDGTNGTELWKTNGTAGNATLVADIRPGSAGSDPQLIYDTGTRLIFSAEGSDNDRELWSTDGVSITLQVADINVGDSFGSDPGDIVELDDVLYFPATSNLLGRELYTLEEVDPQVTDVLVGGRIGEPLEEANRSSVDLVTVVFNGRVVLSSTAIELHNLDTGQQVTSLQVNPRYAAGRTLVELTFDSGPSVVDRDTSEGLGNALADGNYRLDVLSDQVTAPVSGVDMSADYSFGDEAADRFFSLFGDTDGDRDVDAQDLAVFGLSFLQTNAVQRYNEDVDYDGDGDVDIRDMGQFRRRHGKQLNY